MRRADIVEKLAGVESRDKILSKLAYVEQLASGRELSVSVDGLPLHPPRIRVHGAGCHLVPLADLTAADLAACAAVKALLEEWWAGTGEWPIAPPWGSKR